MTSRSLLEERLIRTGFTVSKVNSNAQLIDAILEICADSNESLKDIIASKRDQLDIEIEANKTATRKAEEAEAEFRRKTIYLQNIEKQLLKREETVSAFKKEAENIIKAETPETRDAYRRLLVFNRLCNVQSKYDNTAYINGIAQILGNLGTQKESNQLDDTETQEMMNAIRLEHIDKKIVYTI